MTKYTTLLIILTLVLIGSGLTATRPVTADGPANVYLQPSDQTIVQGQETTVEVWVENVADFYGAQFTLSFDSGILEGVSITPGAAFTDYPDEYEVAQNEIVSNTVKFAATLLRVPKAGPLSGNLHLATITFRGQAVGDSALTFNTIKISDSSGNSIPFTSEGGNVTVVCETTVTGHAYLEGRHEHNGILVTLSGPSTLTTTTDVSGTFAFNDVPPGTYTVTMSNDLYLTSIVTVTVSACQTNEICDVTLAGGDLNGDGTIDILDLSLCAAHFGSADPAADVNADGVVDVYDLVLLGKNFKLEAPIVQSCD